MNRNWGVIGSGYMAREYCKALVGKGITPQVYCRDLNSSSVATLRQAQPHLIIRSLSDVALTIDNWLVCTTVESHDTICATLRGNVYCEKPYAHDTDYDPDRDYTILVNRRYYHWVMRVRDLIRRGDIHKIIASIPEKGPHTLITQAIHVIDLIWYLTGPFGQAHRISEALPTYIFPTAGKVDVVVNMNYAAYENFSLRFYATDSVVYEARPIEAFSVADAMAVREPDDELPIRTYRPVVHTVPSAPTPYKPGLGELLDDLIAGKPHRLPSLTEHHRIHRWMEDNML